MIGDKNLSVSYIVCYALGEGQSKDALSHSHGFQKVKKKYEAIDKSFYWEQALVTYFFFPWLTHDCRRRKAALRLIGLGNPNRSYKTR